MATKKSSSVEPFFGRLGCGVVGSGVASPSLFLFVFFWLFVLLGVAFLFCLLYNILAWGWVGVFVWLLFWGCFLWLLSFLCSLRLRLRLRLPGRCFLLACVPVPWRLLFLPCGFLRLGCWLSLLVFLPVPPLRLFCGLFGGLGVPSLGRLFLVLGGVLSGAPFVGLRPFLPVCLFMLNLPFPGAAVFFVFLLPRLPFCRVGVWFFDFLPFLPAVWWAFFFAWLPLGVPQERP